MVRDTRTLLAVDVAVGENTNSGNKKTTHI
jgi:hypothetical protein